MRELRNAVERLLIMVEGDEIRAAGAAPAELRSPGRGARRRRGRAVQPRRSATSRTPRSARSSSRSSRENGWNISATAAAIDTPRSNLYKKLEAYGISQEKDG